MISPFFLFHPPLPSPLSLSVFHVNCSAARSTKNAKGKKREKAFFLGSMGSCFARPLDDPAATIAVGIKTSPIVENRHPVTELVRPQEQPVAHLSPPPPPSLPDPAVLAIQTRRRMFDPSQTNHASSRRSPSSVTFPSLPLPPKQPYRHTFQGTAAAPNQRRPSLHIRVLSLQQQIQTPIPPPIRREASFSSSSSSSGDGNGHGGSLSDEIWNSLLAWTPSPMPLVVRERGVSLPLSTQLVSTATATTTTTTISSPVHT